MTGAEAADRTAREPRSARLRPAVRSLAAAALLVLVAVASPPAGAGEPRQEAAALLDELRQQLRRMDDELAVQPGQSWNARARYERERILDGLRQFMEMAPHEREAVQMHATRFERLSAGERYRLCRQFRIERGYYPPPCLLPR